MPKLYFRFLLLNCLVFTGTYISAQEKVIDQIVAVVGKNIIKQSDIENQYAQYVAQGVTTGGADFRCELMEELLFQKLLLNQADIDSVVISDAQVESELDKRIKYFIMQIGSQEKLEAYYNKTILQIKADFKEDIRSLLLTQTVQGKITENVKITPSEVRTYFNDQPKDSIPLISSEVEIGEIVKQPVITDEEKKIVKDKLNKLRNEIIAGKDFAAMAVLYSEDPGSASKKGELGFVSRGELYPEFESVAFGLKGKDISPVIETKAGFHIIQLIERRGEMINVRHILMIPQVSIEAISKAKMTLDTVYAKISSGELKFADAVAKYSDDPSKNNGGMMVNTQTNSTKFAAEDMDQSVFFVVDKLKVGEISKPVPMKSLEGKQAYRIVYLKTRTDPHRANLKDDYSFIQNLALQKKQSKTVDEWIAKKIAINYIHISDEYKNCKYIHKWF